MSRAATLAALAALLALNVHLKARLSTGLPRYDPDDETGYFNAESAFQYRYTRMIARGQSVPEVDADAQFPEGVRTRRELTLPMEYLTGLPYRFLPWKTSFAWYVIVWASAVSSLSVAAFFLLALRSASPGVALALSAAYAVSWGGLSDLIGTYGFQCLALPLFFAGAAFFIAALEEDALAWAWAAGAAFAAALASWHVSRFLLGGFFLAAFAYPDDARRRRVLGPVLACLALAGLGAGTLRESRFLVSPAMALGLLLWTPGKRRLAALAACALAFFLARQSAVEASSYGHVYGLLFEKLRHGLTKPLDPSQLGWQARLLWLGPFNSPEPSFLIFALAPLALVIAPRWLARSAEKKPSARMIDAMTFLCAAATLFIARLFPVFLFFFCASAAIGWTERRGRGVIFILALAALEAFKSWAPYSRFDPVMWLSAPFAREDAGPGVRFPNERAVLHWLAEHAGPGAPVLAPFGISGPILAYAGSPVLLNPKLESYASRAKNRDFLTALYSSEEDFSAFCAKNGARFFLYNVGDILDETDEGPRYTAGRTGLRGTDAAVLFHFHPDRLKHFRLAYENADFRVFDVGAAALPPLPSDPIYDLTRYSPQTRPDGSLALDVAGVLARVKESRRGIFRAQILARLGQIHPALEAYEKAFAAWPPDAATRRQAELLRAVVDK